ncbi:hypothetical protein D3C75_964660 [compost metagenome]
MKSGDGPEQLPAVQTQGLPAGKCQRQGAVRLRHPDIMMHVAGQLKAAGLPEADAGLVHFRLLRFRFHHDAAAPGQRLNLLADILQEPLACSFPP